MKVNIHVENHAHELQVHVQKLKGKLETFHQASAKVSQTIYVDN
jgi:hypothetical protein